MIKKRHILALALAICLATSFIVASVGYDPWEELDDDGDIDLDDFALFAGQYGTSGPTMNKKELLLELEARIDSLNTTLLTEYYNITECDVIFVDASGDIVAGYLDVDSGTLYVDDVNNRVGIGTTDPTTKLDVAGDTTIGGTLNVSSITIPTTTRYYTIPPCAWQPAYSTYDFYSEGYATYTTTAGNTSWFAPVNLPHGAVITEIRAWILDNDPLNVSVILCRQTGSYFTYWEMAYIESTSNSPHYEQYADSSINFAIVDNRNCAYYVMGTLRTGNAKHVLGRVRITYTITETLP